MLRIKALEWWKLYLASCRRIANLFDCDLRSSLRQYHLMIHLNGFEKNQQCKHILAPVHSCGMLVSVWSLSQCPSWVCWTLPKSCHAVSREVVTSQCSRRTTDQGRWRSFSVSMWIMHCWNSCLRVFKFTFVVQLHQRVINYLRWRFINPLSKEIDPKVL